MSIVRCTRYIECNIISCLKDISTVQAKGSLMYFMLRHFLDTQLETCFLSSGTIASLPAMFWEYFDTAPRLGNSAGDTSEVMLAGEANGKLASS